MDEKKLGRIVQDARRARGMTQQVLCQKSGLSYSTLAKIERGAIKSPSIFTIQTIANILGMSLDDLMADVPVKRQMRMKKVSRSGVKFVYFDMNGCLVRSGSRAAAVLAQESGVGADVIETTFWQYNDDVCRGDVTVAELNETLSAKLGMEVDWLKFYLAAVEATPGVSELIHWVAANYRIGILTNTMPDLVSPMRANGTLPAVDYDVIIDSSEVRAIKPDLRIFEIAAERAGVSPNEILLVDDDRPNLVAAGKMGWHTMSFDAFHPEESILSVSTALDPTS
jgi:FMN phosphatase YigB (HAD superfamily)/DNA-binding XRE family transcriptional regulator